MAVIKVEHVDRVYTDANGNQVQALLDVNLEIEQEEFISFIGPSGCGKTTLLRLISGLDQPQAGTVRVAGEEISEPSYERGFVFQQANLLPWYTVEENIAMGLKARGVYKQERHKIGELIAQTGLQGFEKSYPHQISGGMAQRVAIARALINSPKALLLDEPMGALDSFTRINLQDALLELWKSSHSTMLLVTHDVDEAVYLSDRIVIMTPRPGKISDLYEVKLPRPRYRNSPEFMEVRNTILEKLHLVGALPEIEYQI
ncbi:MAG: ABC transporter ATP-binding protein [Lachnospiraceae bacterium]